MRLAQLLASLFSADELRSFIRDLPDGRAMARALPGEIAALDGLASAAEQVLDRHGRIDGDLFRRLMTLRPARRADIEATATARGLKIADLDVAPIAPDPADHERSVARLRTGESLSLREWLRGGTSKGPQTLWVSYSSERWALRGDPPLHLHNHAYGSILLSPEVQPNTVLFWRGTPFSVTVSGSGSSSELTIEAADPPHRVLVIKPA